MFPTFASEGDRLLSEQHHARAGDVKAAKTQASWRSADLPRPLPETGRTLGAGRDPDADPLDCLHRYDPRRIIGIE